MNIGRIITSGRYIPEVDGLRFVAILAVILYHIPGNWANHVHKLGAEYNAPLLFLAGGLSAIHRHIANVYGYGVEGVLLFFTISGFILALPFARHAVGGESRVSLKKYFLRRVTRLEPPYVISMLFFLIVGTWAGRFVLREQLPHLAASLLYIHNFVYGTGSTINNAAWSLEVEVQFYILAPLICHLVFGTGRLGWLCVPLGMVAGAIIQAGCPMHVHSLAKYFHYFIVGVGVGGLYVGCSKWFERRRLWADLCFLGAGAVFYFSAHSATFVRELALPSCFGILLIAALKGTVFSAVLRLPLLSLCGGMCYTVYLYHGRLITLPIVGLFSPTGLTGNVSADVILLTLILVPFVFAASVPLFVMLEKPFMNPQWPAEWLRQFGKWRAKPEAE